MKYCSKCGKQLMDEAVVCIGCGCSVSTAPKATTQHTHAEQSSTLATLSYVFAFLIPIVGVILGIIGMAVYKNPVLRNTAKGGLCMSLGLLIVYLFIICVCMQI